MDKHIIYGGGLLGRQVYYIVKTYFQDQYNVVGFADDIRNINEIVVDNIPVIGSLNSLALSERYSPQDAKLIFAIGYSDMKARTNAYMNAKGLGYKIEALIHPKAMVEKNVKLGEGVIVQAGAIVDQFVSIDDGNYLDIGTLIGENCNIGMCNYFSAGTTIGGSVTIGRGNLLGLNTTVTTDIVIGDNNFINAKSLVYKDIDSNKQLVEIHESRLVGR